MIECQNCKTKCVKIGKYVTRNGVRQRYKCTSCGRTYLSEFEKMFDKE